MTKGRLKDFGQGCRSFTASTLRVKNATTLKSFKIFLVFRSVSATLILTVTSRLHIMRVCHVHERDTQTGSWKFVLQPRTIRSKKCVNHNSSSHGIQASFTWKMEGRFADMTTVGHGIQASVTWKIERFFADVVETSFECIWICCRLMRVWIFANRSQSANFTKNRTHKMFMLHSTCK